MTQLEKLLDLHAQFIDAFHATCSNGVTLDPAATRDLVQAIDLLAKQAACLDGSDNLTEHLGLEDADDC